MPDIHMDPLQKQMLDDVFDAFTMLAQGGYVSLMHVEGGFTRYSPAAVELFGLPGEYIPNGADDWVSHIHPEDRKRYLDAMIPLSNGETYSYDLTYRCRINTGEYVNFRFVGAVLRGAQGKPSLIGGAIFNEGLMESTDPVTMLRNQYAFFRDLSALMKGDSRLTALLLGVNRLSELNDTYGYGYGNRILQQVAWTIQETVGDRGTVYRMDGAKFAFLTDSIPEQEVSALYDSIQRKLQRGIRVGTVRHNLTVSGGIASTTGLQMDAGSFHNCLLFAYRESGSRLHGDLVSFNGRLNTEAGESLELLSVVRSAVLDNCTGFFLEYQPVFRPDSETPFAAEALVRWRGDPYGVVPPLSFLPVLEQDFIFEELGSWILRASMTEAMALVERDPDFILGVNISPSQLEDEYFVDTLLQTLKRTGFPAKNLCLELTKGCRLLEVERLKTVVDTLKDYGVGIVIDDYGRGSDSLPYVKALSPDFVKFDLSLVRDIEESEQSRQALRHLTDLINAYGVQVCVKGVETPGMRDILRQYPIRSLQGYYYSKAIPVERFLETYFNERDKGDAHG